MIRAASYSNSTRQVAISTAGLDQGPRGIAAAAQQHEEDLVGSLKGVPRIGWVAGWSSLLDVERTRNSLRKMWRRSGQVLVESELGLWRGAGAFG